VCASPRDTTLISEEVRQARALSQARSRSLPSVNGFLNVSIERGECSTGVVARRRLFAMKSRRHKDWALGLILLVTYDAQAADGALDTSFGDAGEVVFAPNDASLRGYSVAVQGDGNLLIGGERWAFALSPMEDQFAVWRYLADGKSDLGFGIAGLSAIASAPSYPVVYSLTQLPDGHILAAGTRGGFGVTRLNSDGSVDSAFGNAGLATLDFSDLGASAQGALSLATDTEGRILLVGNAGYANNFYACAMARLLPDGTPDATFGQGGRVVIQPGPAAAPLNAVALGVALDSVGRIVVSGHVDAPTNSGLKSFLALRLLDNGSLDSTFGNAGIAINNSGIATDDWANGVTIDADRIEIAGSCDPGSASAALCMLRLDNNGNPDASFGNQGWARVLLNFSLLRRVSAARQSDGKSLLLGTANTSSPPRQFIASRLNSDGSIDLDFGDLGLAYISVPVKDGGNVSANAISLQGGRPILVGTTDGVYYVSALVIARLQSDLIFTSGFQ
jgi:uncharacterized delta-60 repeat protein